MTKSIDTPNNAQISHILGVDFGEAKIGLAIADEETRMAFAFDTLENNQEFWPQLKEIIACQNISAIVVGKTRHTKDDASAKIKERFIEKIAAETGLPIYTQEEMFTSLSAQQNIKLRGQKGISKFDDQEAARIILQDWLDA